MRHNGTKGAETKSQQCKMHGKPKPRNEANSDEEGLH